MPNIRLDSWNPGLPKITLNHAIRCATDLNLTTARHVVDSLLDGERPVLAIEGENRTFAFLRLLQHLGVHATRLDEDQPHGA